MSNNVKIFVCYHKNTPIYKSECIIPIHVGKANTELELDMIKDNTGDNISERNASWCELTALYWIWKNVQADYYGLFHYRRFLNFKNKQDYSIFNEFDLDTINRYGWTDEEINKLCSQYDIISSPVWAIHPVGLPHLVETAYDFYIKDHFKKDLDIVIDLIKEKSPEIYPFAMKSLYSKEAFFGNMLIMKSSYFHKYCEWLFEILFEAEKIIDISQYDTYQKRIWGFLAERLANCYVEYLKSSFQNLKYTHLGMVYGVFDQKKYEVNNIIENIKQNKSASNNLLSGETINITFAIDNNYAKHCAGAIQSILDYANKKQKFNFFILCDKNFSNEIKLHFLEWENECIKIKFLEVDTSQFSIYPLNREHISIATYYRLGLHKILPKDIKKIIYLDADLVVLDNIYKLWNVEFDDNYLIGSPDEGGVTQNRRLNLSITHNYINAGICVMNIEKMRQTNLDHLFAESFYKNKEYIALQDQDILNIAFENKIKRVHCKWNVQSRFYKPYNELEYSYSFNEELEALLTPSIVHYSDREKPWQLHCSHPLKFYYEYYQSKLNLKFWEKFETKKTLDDILLYKKDKQSVQLKIVGKSTVYTFNFNGKIKRVFGKFAYKIVRKYFKLKLKYTNS